MIRQILLGAILMAAFGVVACTGYGEPNPTEYDRVYEVVERHVYEALVELGIPTPTPFARAEPTSTPTPTSPLSQLEVTPNKFPHWTYLEPTGEPSKFGTAVGVFDVTGDAKNDLLISGWPTSVGEVYIVPGPLPTVDRYTISTQSVTVIRATGVGGFGASVAVLGGQLVVGAPGEDKIYFFDLPLPAGDITTAQAVRTVQGPAGTAFGHALAVIDWNKDGLDDLMIGGVFAASVYALYTPASSPFVALTGADAFGYSLAADGQRLLVGNPGANAGDGKVYLYDGGVLKTTFAGALGSVEFLGSAVAFGDVNRDGAKDIGMTALFWNSYAGRAYWFTRAVNPSIYQAASADYIVSCLDKSYRMGRSMAVGDLTGDGVNELAIGAYWAYNHAGGVWMWTVQPL